MKNITFILLTFLIQGFVSASDSTIIFRQMDYDSLFKTAAKENKSVMLYFHFDGCGGCVTMEKIVFSDPKVFAYMNTQFVNFEINTRNRKELKQTKTME